MLIIGAATFPINGSAYYVSSEYGVDWYLIVGRLIYGIGESGSQVESKKCDLRSPIRFRFVVCRRGRNDSVVCRGESTGEVSHITLSSS